MLFSLKINETIRSFQAMETELLNLNYLLFKVLFQLKTDVHS